MNKRFAKTAVMLALAALSTAALAQDTLDTEPPGRVGRVALVQGKVSIGGDVGEASQDALVNWPVTTRNLITTEAGGRTEVRIGSTAIRVDADSSLEITELDDDSMRLRLHYGSASIRILSEDVLPEFELSTPQGRVRMLKPGRLRVDAERVRDTSVVSVFDGEAQVDGGGASLTIRAGRSAELRDEDVRTLQARSDAFDSWALERDRAFDGARSARYVTTDMTGYEELDRHGSWQDDPEYGALWLPTVSSSWVPYRDGRWTWIAPWGWTWVDNAPWGYAPFHYGRWVQVRNRWAWAPGHIERRPVWAPALVGWVGGGGWSVGFNLHGSRPATGWYPLGPRDHFVPGYRLSDERLRRLNAWRDRKDDHRGPRGRGDRDHDRGDGPGRPDYRHRGLTVVPQANFGQRGPVVVPNVPRATPSPQAILSAPGAAPPPPQGWRGGDARRIEARDRVLREGRDLDGERNERPRFDRAERNDGPRFDRHDGAPPDRGQRPPVLSTNPAPQPGVIAAPAPLAAQPSRPQNLPRFDRGNDNERERGNRFDRGDRGGERFEGRRERPQPLVAMPQQAERPAPAPAPVMAPPPQRVAPPPPQAIAPPPPRAEAPGAQRFRERSRVHDQAPRNE
ncbi:hypothetical protein LQ564_16160 [Massilia sp. G4R7]|uniref:FecR family protein n=1 Tax=Massilia phyllostachyos TaxID=2898585 RepID=A0ABS8Q8H8_9BURK|nr:DUF6600 domain-containing protein [Massilia phyllostachyos]MCD2517848.1 hypothetical protein [Massilia phyllostachyos]